MAEVEIHAFADAPMHLWFHLGVALLVFVLGAHAQATRKGTRRIRSQCVTMISMYVGRVVRGLFTLPLYRMPAQ